MPDINGIPYVESSDLVSAYPAASQALAQEVSDQLASKLPYSYGTATPSTTDSGFLWYDSNSTPPVPKYWNGSAFANLAPVGGLALVTSETFTSVSSVSLNGCFTSDYDWYRLIGRITAASSATTFRLRASGSDNTTSNYEQRGVSGGTTGPDNLNRTAASSWYISGTTTSTFIFDIEGPNLSAATTGFFTLLTDADLRGYSLGAKFTASYAADGFSLLASAMSGNLLVYGYQK